MADRRFTVDDLTRFVPLLHGTDTERTHAQQELLTAADALLGYWSRTEHQRAIMQFPAVELDDVRQIVAFHFLKALDDLSLDKVETSSTNWLFHRVATGTRRELANTHGQVRFSRYFLENARRVRAIIARLEGELGRTPTDEEILTASGQAGVGGTSLGPKARLTTTRKPLTAHFLATFREHQHALEATELPEDDHLAYVGPETSATDQAASQALRELYVQAATAAGVDPQAVNIVFCCFGIAPWDEPHDVQEAAALLHVSAQHVTKVLSAWAQWCATPGGEFHAQLADLDPDTAGDLGVGVVRSALGAYEPSDASLPAVLQAVSAAA